MKECDKRNSHLSNKLHMIYTSSNDDRHPVTKTFTPPHNTTLHPNTLHYTCQQFTSSHLKTTLHYPPISLNLT